MIKTIVVILSLFTALPAYANCERVTFAHTGLSDTIIKTEITTYILNTLGYETNVQQLSLTKIYEALAASQTDVFFGNRMPVMSSTLSPYRQAGTVNVVRENLRNTKMSLALNKAARDIGIKTFADITKHKSELNGTLLSLAGDHSGTHTLETMLAASDSNLKGFIISSHTERELISILANAERNHDPKVFLGWAPHPINEGLNLSFLPDADAWFGAEAGRGSIYTNVRAHFTRDCPNTGKLMKNLIFNSDMLNQLTVEFLQNQHSLQDIIKTSLKQRPGLLNIWLRSVSSKDGHKALGVIFRDLGI